MLDEEPVATNTHDFDVLCAPWRDELVVYVTKRTRDRHKAEDIVQDSLVRAMRGWDTWVPQGDPVIYARAWLYRIVSNTFKMAYTRERMVNNLTNYGGNSAWRDKDRDADRPGFKPPGLTQSQAQIAGELHQSLECVHPYMQVNSLGDEVREALDRINQDYAEVVRRVYIDGTSETVVARELGLAPGTVRSRMARGRMALARILAPLARQRFGYDVRRPESVLGGADVALDELEPAEALETDADGVDGVVADLDDGLLDFAEPGPDAYAAD